MRLLLAIELDAADGIDAVSASGEVREAVAELLDDRQGTWLMAEGVALVDEDLTTEGFPDYGG